MVASNSGSATQPRKLTRNAIAAIVGLLGFLLLVRSFAANSASGSARRSETDTYDAACPWQLERYEPSEWEKEWVDGGEDLQNIVCQVMLRPESVEKSEEWIRAASASFWTDNMQEWIAEQSPKVMSFFHYSRKCDDRQMSLPIEPLVGAMRHPFVIPACNPPGHDMMAEPFHDMPYDGEHIMNRGYMIVHPLTPSTFRSLYPSGKAYLFDIGAGHWNEGSLTWFVTVWGRCGIVFDEIYAWDRTPKPLKEFWSRVPEDQKLRLHYHDANISAYPESPDNPLNTMKSVYKPGDYVVVKLDLDEFETEQSLMEQVEGDDRLMAMISEMFFEQHYNDFDMLQWFRGHNGDTKLSDAQQLFSRFRSKGVRLHYWP